MAIRGFLSDPRVNHQGDRLGIALLVFGLIPLVFATRAPKVVRILFFSFFVLGSFAFTFAAVDVFVRCDDPVLGFLVFVFGWVTPAILVAGPAWLIVALGHGRAKSRPSTTEPKDVDARDKPAHDGCGYRSSESSTSRAMPSRSTARMGSRG